MTWLAPVLTLAGTLLGGTLTALVAYFTARFTRRQQLEIEDRRVRRDEYSRLLQKRDELYVRFLQAGKDMELLLDRYTEATVSSRLDQAAKIKDRVIDFDKLAQEVNLYASPQVSAGIDHLVEAWNAWLRAEGDEHERDDLRQEARTRYRAMFTLMQAEVGPCEGEVITADAGPWRQT
jgi:hypothetical protein